MPSDVINVIYMVDSMLQKNYHRVLIVVIWTHRFLCSRYERGSYFSFIMAGQTKTEDTTIKPILLYSRQIGTKTLSLCTISGITSSYSRINYKAVKATWILQSITSLSNDLVAEELPYEQLPDFVESG